MRYLIPEFTGLGDFIQKTPMIRSIKDFDREARIFVIGDNRWCGLDAIIGSDLVDEICNVFDLLNIKVDEQYTNRDFDRIYSNFSSIQDNEVSRWLKQIEWDVYFDSYEGHTPRRIHKLIERSDCGKIIQQIDIGSLANLKFTSWLKTRRKIRDTVYVPMVKGRHDIDLHYDLLACFLARPIERSYDTWISIKKNREILRRLGLEENKYVCIQPGAAGGAPTPKTWHPHNFLKLSAQLTEEHQTQVILVGDSGDFENIICKHRWPNGVINTAGETSLEDLVSLLAFSACAVVHDSGVMHVANAMNVPLVALYGPTDYTRTRPMGQKSRIIYSHTEAFAIMYGSTASERKLAEHYPDHQAMSGIAVDEVERLVNKLISG